MRSGPTIALCVLAVAAATTGCKVKDPPPITAPWTDDFERSELGGNYYPTASGYEVVNGALHIKGAYNHPLWLRKKLPRDVQIDLEVWGMTPDGDLKVEVFGDGESHASDRGAYRATSYVVCMGGWNNSKSFIARMDEHGRDLTTRTQPRVEVGKHYQWRIVRRGNDITWYVDDMSTPFLQWTDPSPLEGSGHEYFGFNNWQSDAFYDNLTITPL